jgi:hypothetical protein
MDTVVVQEVEFFWKGQGSEVLLSGDFLNWESKVPMEKGPNGWFVVKQVYPFHPALWEQFLSSIWFMKIPNFQQCVLTLMHLPSEAFSEVFGRWLWQKLAPGKYTFKFIVDGQWQHSPDYPLVSDNANGFNNEILVPGFSAGPTLKV